MYVYVLLTEWQAMALLPGLRLVLEGFVEEHGLAKLRRLLGRGSVVERSGAFPLRVQRCFRYTDPGLPRR